MGTFIGSAAAERDGYGQIQALSVSPDGGRLAVARVQYQSASGAGVAVYSTSTGRLLGHTPSTNSDLVAYSPNGRYLAVATYAGPTVAVGSLQLLDSDTLRAVRRFTSFPGDEVSAAAFSPDGSDIAYGYGDGSASLIDTATGAPIANLYGASAAVTSISFSSDGAFAATAAADGSGPVILLDEHPPGREYGFDDVEDILLLRSGRSALAFWFRDWGFFRCNRFGGFRFWSGSFLCFQSLPFGSCAQRGFHLVICIRHIYY